MEPIYPRRVKPSELTMINPVWIDIIENPEEFRQIQLIKEFKDVVFLWVLREDGKVIVGIEEPWNFPQAFDSSLHDTLMKMKEYFEKNKSLWKKLVESDGSGGHPTLAAWFASDGSSSCYAGAAYIAGELKFNKGSGNWELSNKSGRFGRIDEIRNHQVTIEEVTEKMREVANILRECVQLEVTLDIYTK